MATSASNAKTNKRNMHNDANKSDAGSKTNNLHDDASSGTDAASQELFEKMFMSSEPKQRTVMGGAMFVDLSRGQFFQRAFLESKIEDLRTEMTEGLPTMIRDDSGVSTTLPFGTWEVRLIETNADDSSITVTLCAGQDGETADDEDSKALRSKLRLERTFQMPSTADLASAEVTIDGRRVTVTASDKDKTAPKGMRPSSPISIVDGEQAMPMQIEIE